MRIACRLLAAFGFFLFAAKSYALQSTTATLTANPAYVTQSDPAVLTVVVAPASGSGVAPTGEVDLIANGSTDPAFCYLYQGSCVLDVFSGSIPPGTSSVVATYRGDSNYAGSVSAPVQIYYDNTTPPPAPVISPPSGTYNTPLSVSLSSVSGTNIYYSFNATDLANYTLYTGPFVGSTQTFVSAYARYTADPLVRSALVLASYSFQPAGQISGFSQIMANGTASTNNGLTLTSAGFTNQAGSAFTTAPQSIQSFTNDFEFVLTNNPGTNPDADGFMFVIQNQGPNALGGYGANLGFGGIPKSAGIKFDLYDNNGEGNNSTGLYLNGAQPTTPSIDLTPSGVNLHSARLFHVHTTYDGATLIVTTTDGLNAANTATQNYTIDLPAVVGGTTAYVGFTGSTGGLAALQNISSWTFIPGAPTATPVFSPPSSGLVQYVTLSDATQYANIGYTLDGSDPTDFPIPYTGPIPIQGTTTIRAIASLIGKYSAVASATYTSPQPFSVNLGNGFTSGSTTLNGYASLNGSKLELTKAGITNQASSAFYPTPVNVGRFITNFDFQITNPDADGFMFVLQNQGPNALGGYGIDLGYGSGSAGIQQSYGIKFDLYNNSGEGTSSTYVYVNGARPTTPAYNLLTNGIDLHSGHIFHVEITNLPYSEFNETFTDTLLTVKITDSVTHAVATQQYDVNLPTMLGGSTAYAGFTAGTGGLAATQDILNWTYMAP